MMTLARICALLLGTLLFPCAWSAPLLPAGDQALRQDIQRLADYGLIKGPVSTWPLAWGPILDDLANADIATLTPAIADALARVRYRGNAATRENELLFKASLAVAENPTRIRSFQETSRGKVEASLGLEWTGDWFSTSLNVQGVESDQDDDEVRVDSSFIGVVAGNWSIAASTLERWWGPGWDGSLILSNNARPIPAVTVDRLFNDAFKTRWLSWLGPWDLSVLFGQLESERFISDARFFGMRFNFRPLPSLEIGLSRTAQLCGEGRPCGFDTLIDLLAGRDNIGDAGIGADNEPGNQLAGVDVRWVPPWFERSFALYGQFIGEDEAGGFPSRWLGLVGGEWRGYLAERWSVQAFAEFAGTSCQFYESSEIFDCAYGHSIYRSGYRYRGRAIGHGADGDSRLISTGVQLQDTDNQQWQLTARYGKLNRGGSLNSGHTLSETPQELLSIDLRHSREFSFGVVDVGLGFAQLEDSVTGHSFSDERLYLRWRSQP